MAYSLGFLSAFTYHGHTEYTILITDHSSGFQWKAEKRYSEMLKFHKSMRKCMRNLPVFPPKKTFGRLNPSFVRDRQRDLGVYFRKLMDIGEVTGSAEFREFVGRKTEEWRGKQGEISRFERESRNVSADEEKTYSESLREVISAF